MKTPDEIKKGLECCHINDEDLCECEDCPYADKGWQTARCDIELAEDILALIQQKEQENTEKDERIHQLEAERDAAIAELANSDSPCDFCKYLKKFAHETPCNNCVHVLHGEDSQFKWRGVQKEE